MKTKAKILSIVLTIIFIGFLSSYGEKDNGSGDYPIQPVSFTDVEFTDYFWAPRIQTNHEVTIPIAIEQSTITGRIKNFEIAGGMKEGEFCSVYPFDDSDIYKLIEAASYSL